MSRKDLQPHRLPTEYEEEVLALLETFGKPKDLKALAELMGVSAIGLNNFLKTTRAQEALARAHPDAKKLLRPHIRLPSTTQDQALPDNASLEGMQQFESDIPEGLVSAYRILTSKRRHA